MDQITEHWSNDTMWKTSDEYGNTQIHSRSCLSQTVADEHSWQTHIGWLSRKSVVLMSEPQAVCNVSRDNAGQVGNKINNVCILSNFFNFYFCPRSLEHASSGTCCIHRTSWQDTGPDRHCWHHDGVEQKISPHVMEMEDFTICGEWDRKFPHMWWMR